MTSLSLGMAVILPAALGGVVMAQNTVLPGDVASAPQTPPDKAPPEDYMQQPEVLQQVARLEQDLLAQLPADGRDAPEARDEAAWLARTAFEQSAIQARRNKPVFTGWLNNTLINLKLRSRGLCWHYQHDLFRELRRRPLRYFRLGATVRDQGRHNEHNCIYVCAAGKGLEDALILDGWVNNGRLIALAPGSREPNWVESFEILYMLQQYFPEGHSRSDEAHVVYETTGDGRFRTRLVDPSAPPEADGPEDDADAFPLENPEQTR